MIKKVIIIFILLSLFRVFQNCKENFNTILEITSNSFEKDKLITQKHACLEKGGSDIIPHLYCKHPKNNKVHSYALIIEDTDSPHERDTNWTHWVVPNLGIIPDINGNISSEFTINSTESFDYMNHTIGDDQRSITQGLNSWDIVGYRGMCPPKNIIHNYKVSIYALDNKIEDCENCTRNSLINKMNGHILYSGATNFKFQSNK